MEESLRAIADVGDMVIGPWEPGGRPWRRLAPPKEEALLLGLNLVGHALRVEGASVALLGTATAPQLVLDVPSIGMAPGS